jgi:Bacterial aa3 type cytochrome c oxidase subunit IV
MAADVAYSDDAYSDDSDQLAVHEDSYRNFVEIVYVGALHVANFVLALAIGTIGGHVGVALVIAALATALSVYSLITRAKAPLAALTVLSLLVLWAT